MMFSVCTVAVVATVLALITCLVIRGESMGALHLALIHGQTGEAAR
ncbi:hypothetical protein HMPREF9336_04186 [Segniliparus rugosus ATCC BAA-974]|uniref:Uncharacterized protein n=1 Tax=Segniliparus rugosus (strain ATCC BAA-974 / DSM 45345 / CCUG 50838 / CIP 108380 / JCM 13579 / CDC 945) TaxID=679197 RepID=U1M2G7_SEGRC|nr:hypothetical protein HMPREF9336_04186 [Segniliparus rugosus ATCC BAA-974]